VTLANLSLMNTRWHLRQIRRREADTFQPGASVALWRPRPDEPGIELSDSNAERSSAARWPKPAGPVVSLTEEQLSDSLLLPDIGAAPTQPLQFGNVVIRFGAQYLLLQDLMTAVLIRDNIGKRPIYFAWSAGGYPDQTLGLSPYLVSQGLVRRVSDSAVVPNDSVVASAMLGYVDVPRSSELLWNAYHWQSATVQRPRGWVDPPSSSILQLYAIVYGAMTEVYNARGNAELAVRSDSIAAAVRANIGGPQP
jgi:hypothetical protein